MKVQLGAGKLAHALKQHWNAHIKPAKKKEALFLLSRQRTSKKSRNKTIIYQFKKLAFHVKGQLFKTMIHLIEVLVWWV